jgi:hypothetical protein
MLFTFTLSVHVTSGMNDGDAIINSRISWTVRRRNDIPWMPQPIAYDMTWTQVGANIKSNSLTNGTLTITVVWYSLIQS